MSARQINLITWYDCFIHNDYLFTELAKLGCYHSPPCFTTLEIGDVDLLRVHKNGLNRPSNTVRLCAWTVCSAPLPCSGRLFWEKQSQYLFSSVAQSCPTLCDPMDCSTPGFPVHHQLPELAQTHVHHVSDAIQPST